MDGGQLAAASRCTRLVLQIRRVSELGCAVVALASLSLAGCASHATTNPPMPHGSAAAAAGPSPSPVASRVTVSPPPSPVRCSSQSGWTGQNLSTAPPNPAAWLTPAQMPEAAIYHWTPQGSPTAQPFAQDVWNPLFGVGVSDYLAWQLLWYQGANSRAVSQTIFLYASATQAHCQYLSAVAQAAVTQAQFRSFQAQAGIPADAIVKEIVSGGDDSAWTASWTASNGGIFFHGPQTDVDYMAQVGTAITFVGFDLPGLNDSVPDSATAQAILSTITQHLSVYASGS